MGVIINGQFPSGRKFDGNVMEGSFYTITVSFDLTDPDTGEWQYKATVKEFPDVECWAYHASQAYWNAVDAVETLILMALEQGKNYPRCPWAES